MHRRELSIQLSSALLAAFFCGFPAAAAQDCDGNGLPDNLDIAPTPTYAVVAEPTNEFPISLTSMSLDPNGARLAFDADNDGDADLAVVNHVPGGVTVHLNDGVGNFPTSTFTPLGAADSGLRVEAADLDGDGDPDLVLVAGDVHILINDGSGTFTIDAAYDAVFTVAIALADLDGDGDIDIARRGSSGSNPLLAVLFNQGNATFVEGAPTALPFHSASIAPADFDNDGDIDLALDSDTNVRVLLNLGDGTFPFAADFPASSTLQSVVAADIDNDGAPDVVGARGFGICVLRNLGGAILDTAECVRFDSGISWLIALDIDDDGDIDLAGAGNSSFYGPRITTLRNAGDGSFAGPIYTDTGSFDISPPLSAADFDGNGSLDLAAVFFSGSFPNFPAQVLFNTPLPPVASDCDGNGVRDDCDLTHAIEYHPRATFAVDLQPVAVHSSAVDPNFNPLPLDLNGDGAIDLVTANEAGDSISVLLSNGFDPNGAWLGFSDPNNFTVNEAPVALAAADFDGDGDTDLASAGIAGGGMDVYLNDGSGAFPNITQYLGGAKSGIGAADLDNDGDIDLVGGDDVDGEIAVSLNQGNGVFDPPVVYDVGENTMRGLALVDFDLDGDIDAITANNLANSISILLNDGDGTFDGQLPTVIATGGEPFHVAAVDLTGDLVPDIAIADQSGPGLTVLLNDGNGNLAPPTKYFVSLPKPPFFSGQTRFVAAADLDGDGDLDLALANRSHDNATVLLNQGDGTFLPVVQYPTGDSPGGITIADLDNDGGLDLATADQFDDTASVHAFAGLIASAGADCNGNGVLDECDLAGQPGLDLNGNGILDECECVADVNGDGAVNLTDLAIMLLHFGKGVPPNDPPALPEEGDIDGDGDVDLSDLAVLLLQFGLTCT